MKVFILVIVKGKAQFVQKVTFETVFFNIFMRQILTDDFWGLHKSSAFPLN